MKDKQHLGDIIFGLIQFCFILYGIHIMYKGVLYLLESINPIPATNEQIIEQTKLCKDNGLDVGTLRNVLTMEIIKVTCEPH